MKKIQNASECQSYREEAKRLIAEADIKSTQLKSKNHEFEITSVGLDVTEGRLLIINKVINGDFLPDPLMQNLGPFETMEDLLVMKDNQEKILANLNVRHHELSVEIYQTEEDLIKIKSRLKMIKRMLLAYRINNFANVIRKRIKK